MRAAVIHAPRDIKVEEVPVPKIKPNEALIRVKVCAICPSDLRLFLGTRRTLSIEAKAKAERTDYPKIVGHEVSGIVEEVGEEVTNFSEGDRVVADMLARCGKCYYCVRGMGNLCLNPGPLAGAFAEFTKASEQNLFKVPSDVSFEEAALTEPLACCINGVERLSIKKGDKAAVIGAGPIGLMHLQLLKLSGASVLVSDPLENRLKIAKELGADESVNPVREDLTEKVKNFTRGLGVNGAIVAVGNSLAIEQGLSIMAKGGVLVIFAGVWPSVKLNIDPNIIHYNEIALTGAESRTLDQFYRALMLISERLVNLRPLISHILALDKISEGFEIASSLSGLKVLIKVN
ncbi:MAG: alcohol dehydrogenase catalytic domain-containing protein [Candidatus Bathyarchaeia archaeon]